MFFLPFGFLSLFCLAFLCNCSVSQFESDDDSTFQDKVSSGTFQSKRTERKIKPINVKAQNNDEDDESIIVSAPSSEDDSSDGEFSDSNKSYSDQSEDCIVNIEARPSSDIPILPLDILNKLLRRFGFIKHYTILRELNSEYKKAADQMLKDTINSGNNDIVKIGRDKWMTRLVYAAVDIRNDTAELIIDKFAERFYPWDVFSRHSMLFFKLVMRRPRKFPPMILSIISLIMLFVAYVWNVTLLSGNVKVQTILGVAGLFVLCFPGFLVWFTCNQPGLLKKSAQH